MFYSKVLPKRVISQLQVKLNKDSKVSHLDLVGRRAWSRAVLLGPQVVTQQSTHGGRVAGAAAEVVRTRHQQPTEDGEEEVLRALGLAQAAVGKSVEQGNSQTAAHHTVQSCCEAASGVATEHVHVHLLQQVHGECVHLVTQKV
jgi:hypothetical protein